MRKIIAFVLVLATLLSCAACGPTPLVEVPKGAQYADLGTPLEAVYFSGLIARCAWDVELHNNRLYVASGDYNTNAGPVYVMYYDFEKKTWEVDATLEDEQITRFVPIDGKLYAPGIDPKGSWDMGTYYTTDGTEWITHESLPGAVHNFDIVKYDGKLFAGLGTVSENSPILVTTDETAWTPVEIVKDGAPCDLEGYSTVRVHEFFTLNGELYAYFARSGGDKSSHWEFYRYNGERFEYHSAMPEQLKFSRKNTYTHFQQRLEYNGYQYFTCGDFYRSADMITPEKITLEGDPEVNDLRVIGKKMYVLCSEEYTTAEGETAFYNSLRVTKNGKKFTEVFHFSSPVRALSFTYESGTVFVGMGFGVKSAKTYEMYEENGQILAFNHVL